MARRTTKNIEKKKVGVFIGRFQPFHNGHLHIIKNAIEKGITDFKIFIGSANTSRTVKNPFTYSERVEMIRRALDVEFCISDINSHDPTLIKYFGGDIYNNCTYEFIPLNDYVYNDLKWALEFNTKLSYAVSESKTPILLGFLKDDSSYYLKMFPELETMLIDESYNNDNQVVNSTEIRKEFFVTSVLSNNTKLVLPNSIIEYLEQYAVSHKIVCERIREEYQYYNDYKASWANSPYPPIFVTADALVVQDNNILLIQRKFTPGKDTYALPGGFIEQNEKIDDAVIRELREETGLKVPVPVLRGSIKQVKVVDNPSRSERGRIITHCYYIHLSSGYDVLPHIKGDSDAKLAKWIPIHQVAKMKERMFEDHWDIIDSIINF